MNPSSKASRFGTAVAGLAALLTFGAAAPVHAAGGGANVPECGTYCANQNPAPSGNGAAQTQPGAGTKGNADNKNPPGQVRGGTGNRGYECSLNQGVAQGNPAHTGCATPDAAPGTGSGDGSGTGSGAGAGYGYVAVPGSGSGYECYPDCGD